MNQGSGLIIASFFVAMVLHVYPLPYGLMWARPEWVAMVLIYWVLAAPEKVGVGIAWLIGILVDALEGALLGQNAIALAVIAYVTLILYQRIRMFKPWQQALVVFVLIGLHQMLCSWVQSFRGGTAPTLIFLLPAVFSALLWPVFMVLMRALRRKVGMIKTI